jgi:DNA repair protein RecO (recombination protein O)
MLHKTSGIILHTINYSDASLIAKVYTEKFGLQSYMISGVRGKKSKTKASLFQPLALVDLVVSNSDKPGLQRISEMNSLHPYADIPYNIVKSSIVIFLNEILFRALKEEHPDEDLFLFIKNSLLILDLKTESCTNFHLCFLLQLSRFLGFYPQGAFSENTPYFELIEGRFVSHIPSHNNYLKASTVGFFSELLNTNFEEMHNVKIDSTQRKMLLHSFVLFFQLHIHSFGEIKSLAVLEEVIG